MKQLLGSLLVLAISFGCTLSAQSTPIRKAPELAFHLPGQGEQLLSQYRGKVVALEFILTTCPHCQMASHLMTKLQADYGGRGFQALDLAINGLEEGRSPAEADILVENFSRTYQTGFPVGWVPSAQMMTFTGFKPTQRSVVPQLILIDRKGMIHYETPPLGDEESMKESTIRKRIEELSSLNDAVASSRPHTSKK